MYTLLLFFSNAELFKWAKNDYVWYNIYWFSNAVCICYTVNNVGKSQQLLYGVEKCIHITSTLKIAQQKKRCAGLANARLLCER